MYGLHQSGHAWYFEIHKVLLKLGFRRLESCNYVYLFESGLVLLLYVDAIVIFGKNQNIIGKVLSLLKTHFNLKLLGKTRKLLSGEFKEKNNSLIIHQSTYINDVCERFKRFHIPISSLPISKGVVFSKADCPVAESDIKQMTNFPYHSSLVILVQYLLCC